MNPEASTLLGRIQAHLASKRSTLTLDGDAHATDLKALTGEIRARYLSSPNYYHGRPVSAEDLVTEMDMAGVDGALIWQNPAAIDYGEDLDANYERLLAANRYIFKATWEHAPRFLPAGWTDPKALGLERALRLVDLLTADLGFPIIKLNPAQNAYPIDSDLVFATVDRILAQGAYPAFHYGGDTEYTRPEGLERVARRYPDTPIIAVHMGGGGSHYAHGEDTYLKTRELGLRQPNLFFILSAKRDTHIESDLITYQRAGPPFARNIACGSDAPYGRMSWNFGGYRAMFQSLRHGARHTDPRLRSQPDLFQPADVRNYLGGNLADLYLRALERLLRTA